MFGTHFYHQKIRKCVAIFGTLFNNLYVVRGGSGQVKVPLSYAPRQKYLERIRENPDLVNDTKVALKLPRMSFEIVSYAYDSTRQLVKTTNFNTSGSSRNSRQKFNTPVPYSINFELNVYAKTQDDALQIVEQILPTFNPQYSVTINPFGSEFPTFKEDIPIIMVGLAMADDFEGPLEARRTIIYTLSFEMKVQFYGPISTKDIIRLSTANIYEQNAGSADSDVRLEKIQVTPNPVDTFGMADSNFNFDTTIDLTWDSA